MFAHLAIKNLTGNAKLPKIKEVLTIVFLQKRFLSNLSARHYFSVFLPQRVTRESNSIAFQNLQLKLKNEIRKG